MLSRPGEIRFGPLQVETDGKQGLTASSLYLTARDMRSEELSDDLLLALEAIQEKNALLHIILSEITEKSSTRHVIEVADNEVEFRQEWLPINSRSLMSKIDSGKEVWHGDPALMHKWG